MATTSQFVQLNKWCMLEYIYSNTPIAPSTVGILKGYNQYNKEIYFANKDKASSRTANTRSNYALPYQKGQIKQASQSPNAIVPAYEQDTNFIWTDETTNVDPFLYDTVKLHIVSGFAFSSPIGFILNVYLKSNDNAPQKINLTNFLFLHGLTDIKYNPTPVFMGDRMYDKFIEITIPSASDIIDQFWIDPSDATTFGTVFSSNGQGFLNNQLINIEFIEITELTEENSVNIVTTGEIKKAGINLIDNYGTVTNTIRESPVGDYLEYSCMYGGEFIDQFLLKEASKGNKWGILHLIEVFEQIGTNFIRTAHYTILQESNFNNWSLFRPIIMNAHFAYSYSVNITSQLINKDNNQIISRKATFTSTSPQKYGASLSKLDISAETSVHKVYNKILRDSENNINFYGSLTPPIPITLHVPIFFDKFNISVTSLSNSNINEFDKLPSPQGENYIFINPFDNFIAFKLFSNTGTSPSFLNISSYFRNINLTFIRNDGTKYFITPEINTSDFDSTKGEILFKIDSLKAQDILSSKIGNKNYYLVNIDDSGNQSLLYSGKYASVDERSSIENQSKIISDLQKQIKNLQEQLKNSTPTVSSIENKSVLISPKIANIIKNKSTIDSNQQSLQDAISKTSNPESLNIVDIPGADSPLGASLKSATPAVLNPSDPTNNKISI